MYGAPMTSEIATGGCLCGALRYRAKGPLRDILHCHCEYCRRITGNFVAASGCATEDLEIEDDSTLRWYDVEFARYGFCTNCGSHVFWQGAEHRERTSLQAGTLDDASGLRLAGVWFADEAQDHVIVDPAIPAHNGNGDESV